jgi:hypothetical protein
VNDNYHEHPFKEVIMNKPSSMTPNQSKEIIIKWKEDKENLEEANDVYSAEMDTEVQKIWRQ